MATKKKVYESKAVTTSIRATSRASIKLGDNFFTVEYCEERSIPEDANVEEERKLLWDVVNTECDNQIDEIHNMYKEMKNSKRR